MINSFESGGGYLPPEITEPKEKDENNIYERGNIRFLSNGTESPEVINMTRDTVEALGPLLDVKSQIKYVSGDSDEPGFCATLKPEFRDEEYFHRVSVNLNYQDKSRVHEFLFHELGHCFEEKLAAIAKEQGLDILSDDPLKEGQEGPLADLIACYVLNPELIQAKIDLPKMKDTVAAMDLLFNKFDFSGLREKIKKFAAEHRLKLEDEYRQSGDKAGVVKPIWLEDSYKNEPLFLRTFSDMEKLKA